MSWPLETDGIALDERAMVILCRGVHQPQLCTGCNETLLAGRRGGKTKARDTDGALWHYDCAVAAQQSRTHPAYPAAQISDLYSE